MSEFQGPLLNKPKGRLGRRNPSADAVFGLVLGGAAATGLALGAIAKLIQTADAEALGINAAYDANHSVLVYHHIERFFYYNPDATLYIMLVAQDTTLTAICDKDNAYLRKLLTDEATAGVIRCAGVVLNRDQLVMSYTTGLHADVLTAVPKAQALVTELATDSVYVDAIILEGLLQANAVVGSLPSLRTLASENVSVCIGADPAVLTAHNLAAYAEIGSLLGMLSIRKVSECLGSVDIARKPYGKKGTLTYPLTSTAEGYFLSAALSNGKPFSGLSVAEKKALKDKGYIYAGRFTGFDGVYFNDSHTCTEASDDYAYIEDNRVWNKAARLLRQSLLPLFRGEIQVDNTTGFLTASQVSYYQAKAGRDVGQMAADNEISGNPTILIEPNQDVVGTAKVTMGLEYRRNGILRQLEADVAAVNPAAE